MSIPIQKVRFAKEIAAPTVKKAATPPVPTPSAPGSVVTPQVQNMSWNILGNERYMPFHALPKTQQRRMTTIYDAISGPPGKGTEKLSMNFYSNGDEVDDLKDYLDFLYSKHRARMSMSSQVEFFRPQTTNFMMGSECYYGLQPKSMSEFEMMVCGRISLVLTRVIFGIMVRNNNKDLPDQLFQRGMLAFKEENEQTAKNWPEPLPGDQPAIREGTNNFKTVDEYSVFLAKRFFSLFKFYLDETHWRVANPQTRGNAQAQPGEIQELPGVSWNMFVKEMRDYSITPSRILYQYMKDIAKMRIAHPERMNGIFDNPAVLAQPLSQPLVSHEEDPDISSVWPARAEHFLGRRGSRTQPTKGPGGKEIPGRPVKEVAFFDARHMEDAHDDLSDNAWAVGFRQMLHRLEQYSKDVIRRTDPDPTNPHAHLQNKRMVFLTKRKIQSVHVAPGEQAASRHDFDGIDYLELPEATVEEVREERLPLLMREQLVAPVRDVPGATRVLTPTKFLYKVKKDERHRRSVSIIGALIESWKKTKNIPGTLEAAKPGMASLARQLATDDCMPYCYNEVQDLLNVIASTPETSFFGKRPDGADSPFGEAISVLSRSLKKDYVMVDPWSRNNKGKLVDSSGSELDSSDYAVEIDDTDPAGSMTLSMPGGQDVVLSRAGTGTAPDSVVGTWRGPDVEMTFSSENHGVMTKGKVQKSFSWQPTKRWKFQISIASMPPAFNPFFKTWLSKIADLVGGAVSAKQVSHLVLGSMSSSNRKNAETGEDTHKFLFDKNDRLVKGKVDEAAKNDYNLCEMDKFMDSLSIRYKDALFSGIVGDNKAALSQFEVWPKRMIEKGYIPQVKGLKKIVSNYKYALNLETQLDSVAGSKDDVETMKKHILQILSTTQEAGSPLGLDPAEFAAINDVGKLRELLISRIRSKKANCFLLYGPAGTGKTSFAGYLAKVLDYNVMYWKIAAAQNMWVGNTTKFINAAFEVLGKLRNFVILIDEVDFALRESTGHETGGKDVKMAFQTSFETLALKAKDNDTIIVSTTNHLETIDQPIQDRLKGRGTGAPTTPILVDVPREKKHIKELIELWTSENVTSYYPSPSAFAEACAEALFQVQNQRNSKNFGIGAMSTIFTEWFNTTDERRNNIVEYVNEEKAAGRMDEQQAAQNLSKVKELTWGPNAFVFLARSLPPVPQSGDQEGQINVGPLIEEANSAERLLGSVSTERVRGGEPLPEPSKPGEQPTTTSPFREQPPAAVSPHGREPAPAFAPSGAPRPPATPPTGPAPTAFNRKMVRRKNG